MPAAKRSPLQVTSSSFVFGTFVLPPDKKCGALKSRLPYRLGRILSLLADDLDEHSLPSPSIEFAVENLFPRPEIQLAVRDRHNDFAAHHLSLDVRIGIIF